MDQNGKEICLRPDLTIASCIKYLNQKKKRSSKVFYNGQAFRKVQKKNEKIIRDQIGFEIIGSKNEKRDDKQIINTGIKALNKFRYVPMIETHPEKGVGKLYSSINFEIILTIFVLILTSLLTTSFMLPMYN